jgi:hypothetical protein
LSELNRSRLNYAITGATAASYYGTPRTTADVDFIVKVSSKNLQQFIRTLQRSELRFESNKIKRQLKTGYNIISLRDKRSPYRVDFIVQRGRIPRLKGSLLGLPAYYQTPESLILAKLRMIKATLPPGRSVKDKNDVSAILANTRVDVRRIEKLARKDRTLDIFTKIQES